MKLVLHLICNIVRNHIVSEMQIYIKRWCQPDPTVTAADAKSARPNAPTHSELKQNRVSLLHYERIDNFDCLQNAKWLFNLDGCELWFRTDFRRLPLICRSISSHLRSRKNWTQSRAHLQMKYLFRTYFTAPINNK